MDKVIRIDKQTMQQTEARQEKKEMTRQQLADIKEFSKDELIGLATITLNELLRDRITLEVMERERRYIYDLARGKEKEDTANAKLTESLQLKESLELKIKIQRQVIEELQDGRIVI